MRPSELFPTLCAKTAVIVQYGHINSPVDLQLYWDKFGNSHVIQWTRAHAHTAGRKEKFFVRDKRIEGAKLINSRKFNSAAK